MNFPDLADHRAIQRAAKDTIAYIRSVIEPGMALTEVRALCERKLLELGADSFWYYDVGAFVFAGDETALSVSGREYLTSDRVIAENDIVTIDLSPQKNGLWGDYARTVVLENGLLKETTDIADPLWRDGLRMEELLHREMTAFATPDTTFEELYLHINRFIREHGWNNLDFLGNLGHSIVREKSDRIYIEKGNTCPLGEAGLFTFEPHIGIEGSPYGFKMENIYYFAGGAPKEL